MLGTGTISGGSASVTISTLTVGTHIITAYYSGDANFAAVTSNSVTVIVQDFSLTILNPNVVIPHGGAGVFNIVVSSVGSAGLASTIQLSMAGGPDQSTHTFSQSTITTGSGATALTLTVQTPNYPVGPFGSLKPWGSDKAVSFAFLGFGTFSLALWRKRRASRRLARSLGIVLLFSSVCIACVVTGCGSGWRTQGWSLTVSATSGNLTPHGFSHADLAMPPRTGRLPDPVAGFESGCSRTGSMWESFMI